MFSFNVIILPTSPIKSGFFYFVDARNHISFVLSWAYLNKIGKNHKTNFKTKSEKKNLTLNY